MKANLLRITFDDVHPYSYGLRIPESLAPSRPRPLENAKYLRSGRGAPWTFKDYGRHLRINY